MKVDELNAIARKLLAAPKGILAADESTKTIEKRFIPVNIANTEENRRAYRELLFTTPKFNDYISGVIMYDETIRQSAKDGTTFVKLLEGMNVLPGIKVDQSTMEMPGSPNEKLTKGIDGLPLRLAEYAAIGAKFAKWRAVITIGYGIPTDANIRTNAKDLAAYARACQEAGIVPIVEPEVLMTGNHTMQQCGAISQHVLTTVFDELAGAGVAFEGMILKTNMLVPGMASGEKRTPDEVAEATIEMFKKVLPENLPGQAFLSGGQNEIEATENLNAIAKLGPFPWQISFSFGRALQNSAIAQWKGDSANIPPAQQAFLHRARMNSLAVLGRYSAEQED
jgi:fructose-bisphosphate aldolase class I